MKTRTLVLLIVAFILAACSQVQNKASQTQYRSPQFNKTKGEYNNYRHNYQIKLADGYKIKKLKEMLGSKSIPGNKWINMNSMVLINKSKGINLIFSFFPNEGDIEIHRAATISLLYIKDEKNDKKKKRGITRLASYYNFKKDVVSNIEERKNLLIFESNKFNTTNSKKVFVRFVYSGQKLIKQPISFFAALEFPKSLNKDSVYSEVLNQFEFSAFNESERETVQKDKKIKS